MEKKNSLLIFLALLPFIGVSQWENSSWKPDISLKSEVYSNSNAVNQKLLNSLLFDIELTEKDMERNIERLRSNSIGGAMSMQGISFGQKWKNRLFGLRLADHRYASFRANGEILELAFRGNSPFEGDTVNLGPSRYSLLSFQELTVFSSWEVSSGQMEFSLSYLNAGTGQFGQVDQGSFYTAPLGSYLWVDMEGQFFESDTIRQQVLPSNGHGLSFGIRRKWEGLGKRSSLELGIQNVGLIYWRGNVLTREVDRQYQLDPSVYDLSNPSEQIAQIRLQDTIDLYTSQRSRSRFIASPFRLSARLYIDGNKEGIITGKREFSLQYLYMPGFIPRLTYREFFRLTSDVNAFASTGFGGFGSLFLGLGIQYEHEKFFLRARMSNLEGLALPALTAGLGGSLQLTYKL